MAHEVKNITAGTITITGVNFEPNTLVDLSTLDFNNGELVGKLFVCLENNDFELHKDSTLIDGVINESFNREVDGEIVETVNESYRLDLIELNKYVNSL